jgi:diguanylate cyclase (GGDEF)-like protein
MFSFFKINKKTKEEFLRGLADSDGNLCLLVLLTLVCIMTMLYFNFFLNTHFTQIYLLCFPITLTGLWYGSIAGVTFAFVLGGFMLASGINVGYEYIKEDVLCVIILMLVGYVIGNLKERNTTSEKIIEHQFSHDMLTGLPNRKRFEEILRKEIIKAKKNDQMVSVFLIDLDGFKDINDILGHIAGDKLLIEVSYRLKEILSKANIVARSGGDEFLALVSNLSEKEEIINIAVKVINDFKKRFYILENEVYVTLSIGISTFPYHGDDAESLISHADIAMYKAKEAGRNTYRLFCTGMNKNISEKLRIANYMRQVVEEKKYDSFVLHYQPQVKGDSGKIVGVEALLRWNYPGQGLIIRQGLLR